MQRMICIPILSDTAIEDIKKANKIADIIELRLDLISKPDIKKLIDSLSSKDKNDQYLGDDKNRQKEKDFGNDWRDWSSDIEDYF